MKLILSAIVALTLFTITVVSSLPFPVAATPAAFTFAASGDLGSLTSATGLANLNALQTAGADFYLSLGDMSYDPSTTGDTWCGQFKAKYNNIDIIPGDHDTGGHNNTSFGETHSYEKYLSGCPLTLNSPIVCGPVQGACYGKEYYFDYPSRNPIARFIFASPKIYNITGVCTTSPDCSSQTGQACTDQYGCWQYHLNDIHYNWASGAIDNARNQGIRWVIVATHKVCISSSDATCSMGNDLFNLLISKKVDLIIQAHDNAYERSKQLALNSSTCTSINPDSNGYAVYNSACIADSGSRGYYTPGAGSVVVAQGAWINDLYGVNSSAPNPQNVAEAPYFAELMGKNTPGAGLGFVKYSVSPNRIDVQTYFSSSFQDSFSIWAGPLTATLTASPIVGTSGQPTVFSGSSSGGTSPYMFSWSFGDNSSTQLGSSVTHTYSAPGNYTVVLNVTDANSAAASVMQVYRVAAPLSISFSVTSPLVSTRLGNFSASASGGVGPYSFSWSFGDNTTGTGVNVQHSYSAAPVNYTVTLRVTDSKGSTLAISQQILVWRTPDLDGDGKVTILDVARVAFAFGTKLGDSNYDARADLNGDGRIDILDIAVVAFYFDSTGW